MATNRDFNKLQDLYSLILEASPDEILDIGLDLAKQANTANQFNQPSLSPQINLATATADDLPDEDQLPAVKNVVGRKLSDKEKEKADKYKKHVHTLSSGEGEGATPTGLDVWSHMMLENALFLNLKTQLKTGKQHSLLVYGDTGIGKTQTVQAFASKMAKEMGLQDSPKKYGQNTAYLDLDKLTEDQIDDILKQDDVSEYFVFIDLNAKSFYPTDYEGVPRLPSNESDEKIIKHLRALKFPFIRFIEKPGARGILFLDELNHAQVDVFNYLFRVIDNHTFGTTKFSDDIFIVAAGNLGLGHGNVNPLPMGLKRRFMSKGFLVLDPDEWIDYAKKAGVDLRIIQFIRSNPYRWLGQENIFGAEDEDQSRHYPGSEREGKETFPTPAGVEGFSRTFTTLLEDFNNAKNSQQQNQQYTGKEAILNKTRDPESLDELYSEVFSAARSSLGQDWATNFVKYLETLDSYSIKGLHKEATTPINGKRAFKTAKGSDIRLYSVAPFLVTYLKPLTDIIISKINADGSVGDIGSINDLKMKVVLEIINACKPEIQMQIIDTLKDPKEFPSANAGAFAKYIGKKAKILFPNVYKELESDVLRFIEGMNAKEEQIQKDHMEKLKAKQQSQQQPEEQQP